MYASTQIAFFAGLQSYYWGSECICDLQIEESFVILLHVIYVSYYIAFIHNFNMYMYLTAANKSLKIGFTDNYYDWITTGKHYSKILDAYKVLKNHGGCICIF